MSGTPGLANSRNLANRLRPAFFLHRASEGLPVIRHCLRQLQKLGHQVLCAVELNPQLSGLQRNVAEQVPHPARIHIGSGRDAHAPRRELAARDFSVIKNFPAGERLKFQFRAECVNAWNHPNLGAPTTNPTSSAFGTITGQDVPRVWQMALKLDF